MAARESKTRGCCQCSERARDLALASVYDNAVAWLRDKTSCRMKFGLAALYQIKSALGEAAESLEQGCATRGPPSGPPGQSMWPSAMAGQKNFFLNRFI